MNLLASKEGKMRRFTDTIPEDVIINILLRVPPETLVGLKVVISYFISSIENGVCIIATTKSLAI